MKIFYEAMNWMTLIVVAVFVIRELYIAHRGGRIGMLLDSITATTRESLRAWARMQELCSVLAPVLGDETMTPEQVVRTLTNRYAELDHQITKWRTVANDPQSLLAREASQMAAMERLRDDLKKTLEFIQKEASAHDLHGSGTLARRYREFITTIKEEHHA